MAVLRLGTQCHYRAICASTSASASLNAESALQVPMQESQALGCSETY